MVDCLLGKQTVADFSYKSPPKMTNVLKNTDTNRGSEDLPTCPGLPNSPPSVSVGARATAAGLSRYIPNS